jgi:hypothetical protein
MVRRSSRLFLAAICVLIASQPAVAVDSLPPYNIDDFLTVSVAEPGDQSFQDTELTATPSTRVLSFDNVNGTSTCDEKTLAAGPFRSGGEDQIGEELLADPLFPGYYPDFIGHSWGGHECIEANVFGGAQGTGWYISVGDTQPDTPPLPELEPEYQDSFRWTLIFKNPQRYVGFWWAAGNDDNYVELLYGGPDPNKSIDIFSTAALNQTLFPDSSSRCDSSPGVNPYCGNPNFDNQNDVEPYAFIHMRYEEGIRGIRFSGVGFEFDNLTFSEEMIGYGSDEWVIGSAPTYNAYSLATPTAIPVDPRSQKVSFPGIVLGGDAADEPDATLCFTQVTDSSGTTAVSSGDTTIDLEIHGAFIGTQFFGPPNFVFSGSQNEVKNLSSQIRIISSPPVRSVVTSTPVWIRVSVSPASSGGEATCTTTAGEITSRVVELRPLRLTNKNQSQVSLD